MNEVTRTGAVPTQVIKSVSVSPLSGGGKEPQGGKVLPPVAQVVVPKPYESNNVFESVEKTQANIQAAVAQMNEYIQSTQRDLQFNYDPDSGETVVKVLDRSTQEVIRQIPDEIFLRLAKTLDVGEPLPLFRAQV
jgi:flagellar protein FlaG